MDKLQFLVLISVICAPRAHDKSKVGGHVPLCAPWCRRLCSSYHTTNTKPYKFPMHCSKCVSFWGTSYSRPHIYLYLTSPCYKILAAPLNCCYWLPGRCWTKLLDYTFVQSVIHLIGIFSHTEYCRTGCGT